MPRGNGEPAVSHAGQQSTSESASPKSYAIALGSSMDLDSVASGDFDRALRAPLLPSRFAKEDAQQDAQQDAHPAEAAEASEQPTGNGAADAGHLDPESGHDHSKHLANSGWMLTACVMLGEMFGLGVLTLPADFARLGWGVALALVLVIAVGTVYSGALFGKLSQLLPGSASFEDMARAALGKHGRWLVYCTVYVAIFLDPVIFHLTSAKSLQQIFWWKPMPLWVAGVIVAAIMVPLGQIQELDSVSSISIVGTVGMVTAVGIALVKLLLLKRPEGDHRVVNTGQDFKIAMVALFDIVFCYGGAQNWPSYIKGMRRRSDFRKSCTFVTVFMTVLYVLTGGVGYWKLGDHNASWDKSQPITSVLSSDTWTSIMNLGLLLHCLIAYQIDLYVWTDLLLTALTPASKKESRTSVAAQKAQWFVLSTVGIAFSFAVSYLVPHFDTVMGFIAAVGDLSALFLIPSLFSLCLLRPYLGGLARLLCYLLIPLSAALSGLGVYSTVVKLIEGV
eukprot:jgi/Astpho2/2391/fgenesh1_pg.00044_%23_35_t